MTHVTWPLERTGGMRTDVRPELVLADSGLPCDTFNIMSTWQPLHDASAAGCDLAVLQASAAAVKGIGATAV